MKKILFLVPLFALLLGVYSCGDNDDISNPHVLTDAEMAEIHRQDSIDSVNRSKIDADLILEYTVEDYPSTSYGGVTCAVEFDKIGECFGLTAEEVLNGINQEDGAPEITGFAIQNSTHADYDVASTTNGTCGHWYDLNGDAGKYSDLETLGTIMFFCEWDGQEGYTVGQYPNKCSVGDSYTAIEGLKYQNKRVAIKITFNLISRGDASAATVVSTQDITATQTPTLGYEAVTPSFNYEKVMSDLGISSMQDATLVALDADGNYTTSMTGDNGFWYNKETGAVDSWGENASICINYWGQLDEGELDPDDLVLLYICQYPGALSAGFSQTVKFGFMANNKIVLLNVTLNVEAYQDPETAPTGTPTTDTVVDVVIEKDWEDGWANKQYDIKEDLREAFKMTTYQIYQAALADELKVYCGEVTESDPTYTSDHGNGRAGYWLDKDGNSTDTGENQRVFCCFGSSETELYLYVGNSPTTCPENTTVTTTYYITCNGGMVKLNITVKIGSKTA